MPTNKPSTNVRYHRLQEQVRILRNSAEDPLAAERVQTPGHEQTHPENKDHDIAPFMHPQEDFERTVGDRGNLESDKYLFADGRKKKGHSQADDEADLFDVAQTDFDDL